MRTIQDILGLHLGLRSRISKFIAIAATQSYCCLLKWSNHRILRSYIFSAMGANPSLFLISSFRILSFRVPPRHRSILISIVWIFSPFIQAAFTRPLLSARSCSQMLVETKIFETSVFGRELYSITTVLSNCYPFRRYFFLTSLSENQIHIADTSSTNAV